MGRLHKSGISQKTCQIILIFKAFGKKSAGSFIDSHLNFLVSSVCWTKGLYKRLEEKPF
jgi:uncharacterized membrane protein